MVAHICDSRFEGQGSVKQEDRNSGQLKKSRRRYNNSSSVLAWHTPYPGMGSVPSTVMMSDDNDDRNKIPKAVV